VNLKDAAKIDDFRDKQIKDIVDAELAKKGMDKTDADTADLARRGLELSVFQQ
jgi:hypothetical protein